MKTTKTKPVLGASTWKKDHTPHPKTGEVQSDGSIPPLELGKSELEMRSNVTVKELK